MRILLVEDNQALSHELNKQLRERGFAVDVRDSGEEGEYMGLQVSYDAIVLDLGLPDKPGLEVLRTWRREHVGTPVIILTARDAWHERVDGFKAGADDYLGKPFHIDELTARLQAITRRHSGLVPGTLTCGGLTLREDTQDVIFNGESITLSGTEFKLLRYFMLNPGKLLSKTQLSDHIYDDNSDKDSNVMEVYVNHLRAKLGKLLIETRRGQGYIFRGNES